MKKQKLKPTDECSSPCKNIIHYPDDTIDRFGNITRPAGERLCGQMMMRCGNCDSFTYCQLCNTCACKSPRALTEEEIKLININRKLPTKRKRKG